MNTQIKSIILTLLCLQSFCQARECKDDPLFQFGSYQYTNSDGQLVRKVRTCAWITKKNAEARKEKWCDYVTRLGANVGFKCPIACGTCDDRSPSRLPEDCIDSPFEDENGNTCAFYAEGDNCSRFFGRDPSTGKSNIDACCACGGGCYDSFVGRNNDQVWYDLGGPGFGCEWYGALESRCDEFGASLRNFGKVANQVCCVCGGGDSAGGNVVEDSSIEVSEE